MFSALRLLWSARMSKVQAAINPSHRGLRKSGHGSYCGYIPESFPENMDGDVALPNLKHPKSQSESGLANGWSACAISVPRSPRTQPSRKRCMNTTGSWALGADSRYSVDIFHVSCRAFAEVGIPPCARVTQSPTSGVLDPAEAKLRGLNGRERGLKPCR
jgi:hypothetical protein